MANLRQTKLFTNTPEPPVSSLGERVQGRKELLALANEQSGASQRCNSCLRTG